MSFHLRLDAPRCRSAAVCGNFADGRELPMVRQDDGAFAIDLDLPDGEYWYEYLVERPDGSRIRVGDPWATQVEEGSHRALVTMRDGRPAQDAYRWRHDDVPLPPDDELVIYELFVADFAGAGRFVDVVPELDGLRELGINAIELLPVAGAGDHWGYLVRDHFAVDPRFGRGEDLKQLIDECHARGMRVIFDMVYNHADEACALAAIDKGYWFHEQPRYDDESLYWGPEFDYDGFDERRGSSPAWDFVAGCHRHWIEHFHIDGIRYDAAKELANSGVMRRLAELADGWSGSKPFFDIAEWMAENPEIAGPSAPLDACWRDPFRSAVTELLAGGGFDRGRLEAALDSGRSGFAHAVNAIHYLGNHDHPHLLALLDEARVERESAFARIRLGMALLLTARGIPLLWMGDEYGDPVPHRKDPAPLQRELLGEPPHRALRDHVRGLIQLRHDRPALRGDEISFFHRDARDPVLCYLRGGDGAVAVIANCGDRDLHGYELGDCPLSGELVVHGGERLSCADGRLRLDLPAWTALLLLAPEVS